MIRCTVQDIVEPEARAAFVWILGEYGQNIQVPSCHLPRRCKSSPVSLCMRTW